MAAHVVVSFSQYLQLPADRAYALLCDWEDHGRWVPCTRVVIHDPDTFTAYTGIWPLRLPDRMRVTARDDANRSVAIEKTGPVLRGTAGFTVREYTEDTCLVVWDEHLVVPYVPAFVAPILAVLTGALFRWSLRRLPPR